MSEKRGRGRPPALELWDTVDWSLTDDEITDSTGRSAADVASERRWRETDWSLTNAVIAREYDISRQAVAQQRARRKASEPSIDPLVEKPGAGAPLREVAGWRIATTRAGLGMTRSDLAEAMSGSTSERWTVQCLWKVERGYQQSGRRLSLLALERFAAVLYVTPAQLLLRPKDKLSEPPSEGCEAGAIQVVIGANVRRWRLHRGWSQKSLARRVKEDYRWTAELVDAVEAGLPVRWLHGIALEQVDAFAKALKVSPAELVRRAEDVT